MPKLIGYMLRPKNDHPYPTAADDQYCRDLAHQIFGTGRGLRQTEFCETHSFWWLLICLICFWRDEATNMLEVWDYRNE